MRKRPRKSKKAKTKKVLRKHRNLRRALEQSRIMWTQKGLKWQDAFCEVYDQLEKIAR